MKTIFITVAETPILRNLLRGAFLTTLLGRSDIKIVLITTPDKVSSFQKEFGQRGLGVVGVVPDRPKFVEKVLVYISRNALKTGTVTFVQKREPREKSFRGETKFFLKRFLWSVGGRSRLLQQAVRFLELRRAPSSSVRGVFEKYNPGLVFSTILINTNVDLPVVVEAKRRGVKTLAMVRGWDNFTSHGFLRVIPDLFLLQDEYLKEVGIKYQFIPEKQLIVVGFPQYDYYFDQDLREPREVFLKRLGLSSEKKIILFGAMGDFLFPKEGEITEIFEELVEEKKIPSNLVMIFRAHPAFESPLEKMKNLHHVISDRVAIYPTGQLNNWDMGTRELSHLINSIVHSEMVINAGSTIGLDAVALGKPAISVAFEKTKMPYWLSAGRFRDAYTHYEDLMKLGGIAQADTKEDLARVINTYLKDPLIDKEGRERIAQKFFFPFDGKVGERIATLLIKNIP